MKKQKKLYKMLSLDGGYRLVRLSLPVGAQYNRWAGLRRTIKGYLTSIIIKF